MGTSFSLTLFAALALSLSAAFPIPIHVLDQGAPQLPQAPIPIGKTRHADPPPVSSSIDLTDAERAFLQAHPEIVLGTDGSWAPLVIPNPDGSYSGIDADTLARVNTLLGAHIRLRTGPWLEMVQQAKERKIDGLSSSAVHEGRRKYFLFTRPYTTIAKAVFVKKGNPLGLRATADLAGKRVGFQQGNLAEEQRLKAMPGVIPVPLSNPADLINALLGGDIDAVLSGEGVRYLGLWRLNTDVETAFYLQHPLPLVFSIRNDWPLLVSAMDKALARIPEAERLAIKARYLNPEAAQNIGRDIQLDAHQRAYLEGKGWRLRYCFSPVWRPFDYLDHGEHKGMFRDYLHLFAQKLGVTLVPVPSHTWGEALEFAQRRDCDLVSGAVRNRERERYLAFTTPYYHLTHVLLARAGEQFVGSMEQLAGRAIGVPGDSAIARKLRSRYPAFHFVDIHQPAEMQEMLDSGRIDAAVAVLEHAAQAVQDGMGKYRIIGKLDNTYPVSVAVRNDAPALLQIMQKAVDATTPAEQDEIGRHWTKFTIDRRLDYTLVWQGLGVLGIVALFAFYRHRALARANRKLAEAKRLADEANETKSLFVANMSHEIRTPLNAVLNLAELALETEEPERQRQYLQDIRNAGRSLLGVVEEVLDFSKIEAGKVVVEAVRFDLREVLDRSLHVAWLTAKQKGLEFSSAMDPELPSWWVGDPHKLGQVLVNLVNNGVKFTASGQVEVTVQQDPGGAAAGKEILRFCVRDSGIGIAADQLARLFQPFHQTDASTTRSYGGTGLGLAIVKGLVEAMGGTIRARSRLGEGSEFCFRLPLTRADAFGDRQGTDTPAYPETAVEHTAQGAAGSGQRGQTQGALASGGGQEQVLVVEDNPLNQRIAIEFLAAMGVGCDAVGNGAEAVERLRRRPDAYGLVLMDIQMPVLDGYGATHRIRQALGMARIPIVAMTAHARSEEVQRCKEAGMDDFIAKPIDRRRFVATVGHWLRRGPKGAAQAPLGSVAEDAQRQPAVGVSASALAQLRHFDSEKGIEWTGKGAAFYVEMLAEFYTVYKAKAKVFDMDGGAERWQALGVLAHGLKSIAAILGADELRRRAIRLEDEIDNGGTASQEAVAALRKELTETMDELRAWLQGTPH